MASSWQKKKAAHPEVNGQQKELSIMPIRMMRRTVYQ